MKKCVLAGLTAWMIFFTAGCGNVHQGDPNAITVWHWMADRHEAFLQLAERYKEKTGVAVNFQLFTPSDIYSQKITAAAQAGILPDIFGILDKTSVIAEFIKSGFVLNLKDTFAENDSEWQRRFFEKALAVNAFEKGNTYGLEPGIYGVPLDMTNMQMVYNKKLLKDAGIEMPPSTFDEFVAMAPKLRAIGVTPFVSGWGELWLIDCFSSNYAFNIMGEDKVMATYRGEVPYTDPDWIAVFRIFQVMAREDVVDQGIVIKRNKFAEQDFALGRAAFAFNGSWCVNVYHGMNPDLDYGVLLPPPVSKRYPLFIWGGAGSSFVINAHSSKQDKSIMFLQWLTEKDQQKFLSEATANLPANRYALADLPPELADFAGGMEHLTHPTLWPVEEDAVVKEKFTKGLQSILIGEKTPQQVAQDIQAAKTRQVERAGARRR